MDAETAARLIEINREFYTRFGDSFSATRHRIQPGVRRVLEMLRGDESILDLGCGNGELARELAKRGHRGSYLGVDFSRPLLLDAGSIPEGFPAKFIQADLTSDNLVDVVASHREAATRPEISSVALPPRNDIFDIVFCFAVLHHIPSDDIRLNILKSIRGLLADNGKFIHSNWQFLNSEKLKMRIKPWQDAAVQTSNVDAGDYLLDWRSGGEGLRYVHHFSESELSSLAGAAGFVIGETFYSDGVSGNLGLYQIWEVDPSG